MCYHPWVGLDISQQGEYKPCCKYENIVAKSLEDYLASDELANLKKSFLAGEKPSGCGRCWRDEDAGIESKRELDNRTTFNSEKPDTDKLKVLSLPFGNTCNLACRTCKSYASSRWLQEEKEIVEHFPELKLHPHNQYYKDNNFIDKIKQLSDDVTLLEFPGGEPFITGISEHLDFLDYLIQHNAKNMTLRYMTNVTILPDIEFWDKWKHFKQVDIQLSIDGVGKVFDYTRWPASWDNVYPNIKFYQRKQKEYNNIQLSVGHTISIFNVYYLDMFLLWCEHEGLPGPYLGCVSKPDQYNITVLSPKTKQYLDNHLTHHRVHAVKNFMNNQNNSHLLDKLYNYVTIIDEKRSQKFTDNLKEFGKLLKETCSVLGKL